MYLHHRSSLEHDPRLFSPGHPDSPKRIEAIETELERAGWPGCVRVEAPEAELGALEFVHSPAHIARIERVCASGGGQVGSETYVGPASYTAALHAAGGACAMVRELVRGGGTGFCALRPAGHHAERDHAMGFCLFNNVAIAAEFAIREFGLRRVFVLDWDVHHGNGTAEFFRRRSDVLYASIHQSGLYPGSGALADAGSGEGLGYTINVPLPRGADEELWLSALEHIIVPAALEFGPQLILVSAGFDGHRADPLGGCALEASSYAQMTAHVVELASRVAAPVGAVLEGGYQPEALAESVLAMVRALGGEIEPESIAPDPIITSRVAAHVGHFWSLDPLWSSRTAHRFARVTGATPSPLSV